MSLDGTRRGSAGRATPRQPKSCIAHEEEETMPCEDDGTYKSLVISFATLLRRSRPRGTSQLGLQSALAAVLACGVTAATAEAPKPGGVLTYMIPADGGPRLDGHRGTTHAVGHATAPFYNGLIPGKPDNPPST